MVNSIRSKPSGKPRKPRKDFPLFPHASGRWAKKVRGKFAYFGKVADDPKGEAALNLWLEQKDDLLAGRTPRAKGDGLTVADLCNRFLTSKRHQLDTLELNARTFRDYYQACALIVSKFGKSRAVEDLRPEDFESLKVSMPSTWGPVSRGRVIQLIRSVFRYAVDEDLVEKAIKFGKQFRRPSRKTMRLHRAGQGKRMFERDEVDAMLKAASPQLRAMFLLAVNCGFGNNDVAMLPISALNLETGWADFPRPKTGMLRRCPLWPETIDAVRLAISARVKPKDESHSELVFLTRCGTPWVKVSTEKQADGTLKVKCDDAVSKETRKLLKRIGINGHRAFYSLRHTHRTIADETKDRPAIDLIMGHAERPDDMGAVYTERIGDERLRAVTDHVRAWLFGTEGPSHV